MSNLDKTFEALPLEAAQAARLVEAGRGVRDRAILAMLWRGGLRANELCSLRMEHVRLLEDGTAVIKVNQPKNLSKGAPKRVVAIGKKAADLLRTWLAKRGDEPGPFFRTHAGKRLCTSQIRRTVALAGQRAKLGRRVHPHALRHTFAHSLYYEGVGVLEIQEALGHGSVDTTRIYLNGIGATRVVSILANREEW
jgi:integrase